jgi:hypothetical protein
MSPRLVFMRITLFSFPAGVPQESVIKKKEKVNILTNNLFMNIFF